MQVLASLSAIGRNWLVSHATILIMTQSLVLNPLQKGPTFAHISIKLPKVARQCTFRRLTKL